MLQVPQKVNYRHPKTNLEEYWEIGRPSRQLHPTLRTPGVVHEKAFVQARKVSCQKLQNPYDSRVVTHIREDKTELQNSCVRECTIDPVCQESRFTRKNIEEMINIIFINDTNFCRANWAAYCLECFTIGKIGLILTSFSTPFVSLRFLMAMLQFVTTVNFTVHNKDCSVLGHMSFMPATPQSKVLG